jgi:hypothetical protein
MVLWDKKGKRKGYETELKFKKWLNEHKIHYLYIKQDLETFPSVFEKKLKRPDFVILLQDIGFIMVDVKYKHITDKYGDISIDAFDLEKYALFQSKFHISIWYVISNENLGYKTWFWIPVSKILDLDIPKYKSSVSNQYYYPVKLKEFVKIDHEDSLAKIFSKSF